MIKIKLKGFTLIEMATTLCISAAFSIGLYSVFLNANKSVGGSEVLYDVKSYSGEILSIISEKIRNADEIEINNQFGSTMITATNQSSEGNQSFEYKVVNNLVYENGLPMKQFGYHWLEEQDLYEIDLVLNCSADNVSYYDSSDENLRENIYDLDITLDVQSKSDNNYNVEHKSSNRIFSINKFLQTSNQ